MTDWLLQFNSIWLWILLAIVLVIVFILVVLSSVVRRSSAAGDPHPAVMPPEDEEPAKPAWSAPAEPASASFSRAVRYLRSTVSGRDFRYQIPWYVVVGDPGSGKSALLRAVGV